MIARRKLDLLLLASAIGGSRFFFRSHYLYDLDSVNFALALQRFDPRVHQPHPPGYYLYIWLGRALNWMVGDANLALVLLSILASCGVVVMIYILTAEWFGALAARLAGALFVFSPLAWFHGIVALTYSVEAFFSAVLGYLCWQVESGEFRADSADGHCPGNLGGHSPNRRCCFFLGPLFLFALRKAPAGRRIAGLAATAVTVPLWFIPMIRDSGGLERYFGALISLWRLVPATDTVFNSSPGTSIARAFTIGFIYLLSFGAAAFIPLYLLRPNYAVDRRKWIFTTVWVAPALCFFTLIFLKFVNSGYLLLLVVPGCIWMGHWAAEWYEGSSWKSSWKLAVFAACATQNAVVFFTAPFFTVRMVRCAVLKGGWTICGRWSPGWGRRMRFCWLDLTLIFWAIGMRVITCPTM